MSKYIVDIHGDIEGDYEIIKEYEEPKVGWIPVSERPPEDYLPCWCTIRNHHTYDNRIEVYDHVVVYHPTFKTWYNIDSSKLDFEVIAWMPVPEPYEVESEE